jgi:hypothetical protein
MRALKYLFLLTIFMVTKSFSQVSNYTFSETTGTYTVITLGTQLVTTTAGSTSYDSDGSNFALAVGNRFVFNGTTITSVTMQADGSLWLNPTTSTTGNGVTGPLASAATAVGIVSAMGMDLRSTSVASTIYERRWYDDGTEDIFQWQNCARYLQSSSERFSFQIRINKTTDVVRVVYGNMTTITTSTTYQPMVGLRGTTNTDYNNRRLTTSIPDATPNWGEPDGTTAGTSNAHTVRFRNTCLPTSGLTFVWTPPVPLPIELISFEGISKNTYNYLFWKTASEYNNDYFTIEKTLDGINFTPIANINGAGNSNMVLNYDYIDYNIINTITYYRLKQTDYDGKYEYSNIIGLDNTKKVRLVVRVINLLGNDVDINSKGIVILIYDDGSVKKIFNE